MDLYLMFRIIFSFLTIIYVTVSFSNTNVSVKQMKRLILPKAVLIQFTQFIQGHKLVSIGNKQYVLSVRPSRKVITYNSKEPFNISGTMPLRMFKQAWTIKRFSVDQKVLIIINNNIYRVSNFSKSKNNTWIQYHLLLLKKNKIPHLEKKLSNKLIFTFSCQKYIFLFYNVKYHAAQCRSWVLSGSEIASNHD